MFLRISNYEDTKSFGNVVETLFLMSYVASQLSSTKRKIYSKEGVNGRKGKINLTRNVSLWSVLEQNLMSNDSNNLQLHLTTTFSIRMLYFLEHHHWLLQGNL